MRRYSLVSLQVDEDGFASEVAVFEALEDRVDEIVQSPRNNELNRSENGSLECFRKPTVKFGGLFPFGLYCLKECEIDLAGELVLENGLIVEGKTAGVRPVAGATRSKKRKAGGSGVEKAYSWQATPEAAGIEG